MCPLSYRALLLYLVVVFSFYSLPVEERAAVVVCLCLSPARPSAKKRGGTGGGTHPDGTRPATGRSLAIPAVVGAAS